jgi:menaquinone-dependent protoporphyrinogen oxidase
MRTVIIFATNHGSTQKVAEHISKLLDNQNVDLINLKQTQNIPLEDYDYVVIGGSIHAGKIQKIVNKFCFDNIDKLLTKKIALYLCAMHENEFESQLNRAYPEELRNNSKSNKVVGGEFLFEKMNFIERFIVKKIAKINSSVSKLNHDKIEELVKELYE